MRSTSTRLAFATLLGVSLPATMGAKGDGCAANSKSPAPDVTGTWAITYDDMLDVEIALGGQVYQGTVPAGGGIVTINHGGQDITFDLDCARPEILCPSEAWPETVTAEQRNAEFQHQMIVTLPTQICSGTVNQAPAAECGPGTENPECDPICDGEVTVVNQERFGVIGESGDTFRLYLGGGIVSNGINCALLGVSVADADLVSEGRGTADWQATEMTAGLVTVAYAGGCLWVGDPNMDQELEALVIGAAVTFKTGFTGVRQP
jgi:hypothetical protein